MIGRDDDAEELFERLLGPAQRPRAALRGVRPAGRAPGRQLPPGLLPRVADQLGLPAQRATTRSPSSTRARAWSRTTRRRTCERIRKLGRVGRATAGRTRRAEGADAAQERAAATRDRTDEEDGWSHEGTHRRPAAGGHGRALGHAASRPSPTARCSSRRWPSASAAPTSRSSRATTAGRRPARSAWCSATSRSAGSSRRRPAAPVAKGDLVVGIVRRPDPVPCANCAVRRVGLLPQRAVHRAGHQGARRLLLGALPDHARLRRSRSTPRWVARRAARADERGGQGVGAGGPDRRPGALGPQDGAGDRRRPDRAAGGADRGPARPRGARARPGDRGRQARPGARPRRHATTPGTIGRRLPGSRHRDRVHRRRDRSCSTPWRNVGAGGVVCLTGVSSGGHIVEVDEGLLNRSAWCWRTWRWSDRSTPTGATTRRRRTRWPRRTASWLERLVTRRVPLDELAGGARSASPTTSRSSSRSTRRERDAFARWARAPPRRRRPARARPRERRRDPRRPAATTHRRRACSRSTRCSAAGSG